MKELSKNEISQVNGGIVGAIAAVVIRAAIGYAVKRIGVAAAGGALGGAVAGALERK